MIRALAVYPPAAAEVLVDNIRTLTRVHTHMRERECDVRCGEERACV